jgi:hypothetical protein
VNNIFKNIILYNYIHYILDNFEENIKAALFLSVIGDDALEMFEGMDFAMETDRQILSKISRNSKNSVSEKQTKRMNGLYLTE